jgi:hypothetical protein
MNQPSIDLYRDNGIDIGKELLEIAVCAQHNNGGLKGNIWWESNIKHLFPVGEVNGTHGVYRPGGSALNSGQVGGLRAAMFIAQNYNSEPPEFDRFLSIALSQIRDKFKIAGTFIDEQISRGSSIEVQREKIQERMSTCGAHIRDPLKVKDAIEESWSLYNELRTELKVSSPKELPDVFKNLDLCLTHALYLEAIGEYLDNDGRSRGSFLVLDPDGESPCDQLGDDWRFRLNPGDSFVSAKILEISLDSDMNIKKKWVDIRPIPQAETWFEKVWKSFLIDKNIK